MTKTRERMAPESASWEEAYERLQSWGERTVVVGFGDATEAFEMMFFTGVLGRVPETCDVDDFAVLTLRVGGSPVKIEVDGTRFSGAEIAANGFLAITFGNVTISFQGPRVSKRR